MNKDKPNILYVDDEVNNLNSFKANLRHEFNITICNNPNEVFEYIEKKEIMIVISDQRMPELTGVELLSQLKSRFPFVIRILLTGFTDYEVLVEAVNKGEIYRYLTKPVNYFDLKQSIYNASEVFQLNEDKRKLIEQLSVANSQLEFMLREKLNHEKQ